MTQLVAIIGMLTGITGMVLGILNFILAWNRDRVRLSASIYWGYESFKPQGMPKFVAIHVINLSTFPLTIIHAGFEIEREDDDCLLHHNDDRGEIQFPAEIGSRQSFSFFWPIDCLRRADLHRGTSFFVRTDCAIKVRFAKGKPRQMKAEYDTGERFISVKAFLRPKVTSRS